MVARRWYRTDSKRKDIATASMNPKRMFIAFSIILGAGIPGYVIGTQGAGWAQEKRAAQYRAKSTIAAVSRMNDTIRAGNRLPDHEFHNLRGGTSKLSDLVGEGAIVAYLRSSCGKCRKEMEDFGKGAQGERQSGVIIISDSDPQSMLDLAGDLELSCPLLFDSEGQYRERLGVWVFPFNIIVNDSMLIENMMADYIRADEFAQLVQDIGGDLR
jgi:peroxiredoxin